MSLGIPELMTLFIMIVGGALWIWMLIDCASNEPPGTDKIVWMLVILLGGCIGAFVYLVVRRPKRRAQFGG